MKKKVEKKIALVMCAVMIIGIAPLSGLVGIDLPGLSSLISVKAKAENGTYGVLSFQNYYNNGGVSITGCDRDASGELVIPDTIEGYPVTSIGCFAFYDCTGLTSITIPDSVSSIDDGAFWGCTGLTSITIPDSVTSIGVDAFSFCTGLTSITISDSVTSIGDSAFAYCDGLTDVYFTGSEEEWNAISIGSENDYLLDANIHFNYSNSTDPLSVLSYEIINDEVTITGCDKNASGELEIPGTIEGYPVTSIGVYAFAGCADLTSITIPDSVTSIGYGAFSGCTGLTSITIPDNVTSIGDFTFDCCAGLTSIIIPDSVTSIGDGTFIDCTGLTSIIIPDSVTSIDNFAFYDCTGLTDVYFTGSEEEWYAIVIGKNNDCLTNATIHYNHEHSYTSETTVTQTCTEDGEITYTCECGDTYTEVIAAAGHKPASPVKENIVPATFTEGGSYDEVVYCSVCSVQLSRKTVVTPKEAFISGEIDKTAVVRGSQGVWTVKTADDVEWIRFNGTYTTSAGKTYNSTVYFKASNYMNATQGVTVSDNDGERIWIVPMTFNFSGIDDTVTQTWSVTYKVKNSSLWVDSPYSQEITIGKTEQSIAPKPLDYAPYSLVSANCDFTEIGKGSRGDITIVTTIDCNKVRITYTDAATGKTKASTFQTTSKSNVSFSDDATTGLRTWTIGYKFAAPAQNDEFRIDTRGIEWTETKTVNVEVK